MGKYLFTALAMIFALSSCSTSVHYSGAMYEDGLYYRSESSTYRNNETRLAELANATEQSDIYLIGTENGTDTLSLQTGQSAKFRFIEDTLLVTVSDGIGLEDINLNQYYFTTHLIIIGAITTILTGPT